MQPMDSDNQGRITGLYGAYLHEFKETADAIQVIFNLRVHVHMRVRGQAAKFPTGCDEKKVARNFDTLSTVSLKP